jgi:ubiquinone/menaquinone biosynthesis C-methylase UbiE
MSSSSSVSRRQDVTTAKRAAGGKGKSLEKLYGGYFGKKENCALFAKYIPKELFDVKNPVIVDAGSGQGILGDFIRKIFLKHGSRPKLILIDANKIALGMSPIKAKKIVRHLTGIPLRKNSVDLIVLRSVLQYMEPREQVQVLKELFRCLKPNGALISQFGSFKTQQQANLFNKIFYIAAGRQVKFCGKHEGIKMHKKVCTKIDVVGKGPTLHETFNEFFIDRINANQKEQERARRFIHKHIAVLGNVLTRKTDPYAWQIPYTVIRCRKALR